MILAFVLAAVVVAADTGPAPDVAAVRSAETAAWSGQLGPGTQLKIEKVRVIGDWAVLEWIAGESGGMSAYHRSVGGSWKRLMHGGGAFGAADLEKNGCPASVARQLIPGSPG